MFVLASIAFDGKSRGELRQQFSFSLAHVFHEGQPRAALQFREQRLKLGLGAHRVYFHPAVAQVSRVAADVLSLCGGTSEKTITDALHSPGNVESPPLFLFGHADQPERRWGRKGGILSKVGVRLAPKGARRAAKPNGVRLG